PYGRICSTGARSRTLLQKPKTAGRCRVLLEGTVAEGSAELRTTRAGDCGSAPGARRLTACEEPVELRPVRLRRGVSFTSAPSERSHHPEGGHALWQGPTRLPR